MKRLLIAPSLLALCLTASPAIAQEGEEDYQEDQIPIEESLPETDEGLPEDSYDRMIVKQEPDEDEPVSEEEPAEDPEALRAELTALMDLPVLDKDNKRIGVAENVVMKDGKPELLIIKLDNVYFSNKLRAVASTSANTVDEGAAIKLDEMTRSDVKALDGFKYAPEAVTLKPLATGKQDHDS